MTIQRLLYLGNVVVDIVLDVPALPGRGGDVLARGSQLAPGGGFNVMAAAARQGLPVAYAGAHGRGPFADLARAALAAEGIEVLQPAKPDPDTGFVVAMVDDTAERTFVTSRGAEATLTAADLAAVTARPGDAACLSGYGLVHPSNRGALLGWLARLPEAATVVFDPGPLVTSIPPGALDQVPRPGRLADLQRARGPAADRRGQSRCCAARAGGPRRRSRPPRCGGADPHRTGRLPAGFFRNEDRRGARLPGHRTRLQRGGRHAHRGLHRGAWPRGRTRRRRPGAPMPRPPSR